MFGEIYLEKGETETRKCSKRVRIAEIFGKFQISERELGYLKDSNAVEHSVDSDIFFAVIHLPARSKTLFLNVVSNRGESVLVCINFTHDDASIARSDKGSWQQIKAHCDLSCLVKGRLISNDTHQPLPCEQSLLRSS